MRPVALARPLAKSGAEARHLIRQYNRKLPRRMPRYRYTRGPELEYQRAVRAEFDRMQRKVDQEFVPALLASVGLHDAKDDKPGIGAGPMIDAARNNAFRIGMGIARMHEAAIKAAEKIDRSNRSQVYGGIERVTGVRLQLPETWKPRMLRDWATENAKLVNNASGRFRKKLVDAVTQGVLAGRTPEKIAAQIRAQYVNGPEAAKTERKLNQIVRDQTAKLHGRMTKERHLELGIKRYTWVSERDERVRETHSERDGEVFEYGKRIQPQLAAKGLKIDQLDGHPSEPPNCRCHTEPVLSDLIAEGIANRPRGEEKWPKRIEPELEPEPEQTDIERRREAERLELQRHLREQREAEQREQARRDAIRDQLAAERAAQERAAAAAAGQTGFVFDPGAHKKAIDAYGAARHRTAPRGRFNEQELSRSLADIRKNDSTREKVVQQTNELLAEYGIVNRDASKNRHDAGRIFVDHPMPNGAAAYHGWSGEIALSDKRTKQLVEFGEGKGDRIDKINQHGAVKDLIHEALHGASPAGSSSYIDHGAVVEEVTTEVVARKIVRERVEKKERFESRFTPEFPHHAYSDQIREVIGVIDPNLLGLERASPEAKLGFAKVGETIERASLFYKEGTDTRVATADQAVDRFAKAILKATNRENDGAEYLRVRDALSKLRIR